MKKINAAIEKINEIISTKDILNKISDFKWENVMKAFDIELEKKGEKIFDNSYLSISSFYEQGRGILIDITNANIEKSVLTIHEYQHFIEECSGAYSYHEESIDDKVRSNIALFEKLLHEKNEKNILEELKWVKKFPLYEKLFK